MSNQAKAPPSFPELVQAFFADYLTQQRALSAQTVAAYRDAFMLFLRFAEARLGKPPTMMALSDLTPGLITAFLDDLEKQRHNSVRSRNARLAALRSFLKFAAHRDVSSLQVVEQALGVPSKRFERPMIGHLSREEMLAVIAAPDATWLGRRDHVLFLVMYNTGARVSEVTVHDLTESRHSCPRFPKTLEKEVHPRGKRFCKNRRKRLTRFLVRIG